MTISKSPVCVSPCAAAFGVKACDMWAVHLAKAGVQAMVESLLSEYPNVLVLRVRMPIVGDLLYPRNFITKIIKYEKV